MKQLQRWQGVNPKKDAVHKKCMLEGNSFLTEAEIDTWLKHNPPDDAWADGQYAWAAFEMPVTRFHSWWRKNILGWKI